MRKQASTIITERRGAVESFAARDPRFMLIASRKPDRYRKRRSLFLTPVPVADSMAGRIEVVGRKFRILDPAAGAGILCCAAVAALASRASSTSCTTARCGVTPRPSTAPTRPLHNRFVWSRAGVFNRTFEALAAGSRATGAAMIDVTHLKTHRMSASLLGKEIFRTVSGAPGAGPTRSLPRPGARRGPADDREVPWPHRGPDDRLLRSPCRRYRQGLRRTHRTHRG